MKWATINLTEINYIRKTKNIAVCGCNANSPII